MDGTAATRIQSATAKANGGGVPAGSFAARAQRTAARNANANAKAAGRKWGQGAKGVGSASGGSCYIL
jgi:hypothetical protein